MGVRHDPKYPSRNEKKLNMLYKQKDGGNGLLSKVVKHEKVD